MSTRTIVVREVLVVLALFLGIAGVATDQQRGSAADLLEQFKTNCAYSHQFQIAQKLVSLHDTAVLPGLAPYLKDDDRHVRGNAALVFAGLGDDRGLHVIYAILRDRSDRPRGQGTGGNWSVASQIVSDRYYAAHLLGDLKDPRAVPILVSLLKDAEVNWVVPWALGEIGDRASIPPLIQTLNDRSPDMRVLSIYALEKLKAKEALPQIRSLVQDDERIHFDGLVKVGEAANSAVAKLAVLP